MTKHLLTTMFWIIKIKKQTSKLSSVNFKCRNALIISPEISEVG